MPIICRLLDHRVRVSLGLMAVRRCWSRLAGTTGADRMMLAVAADYWLWWGR